ncbi:Ger(x)C family spore germination protein [Paenibacillus donghaensis]|uniref:Ger(x)C family spore germination protein n=1 Tax=Paenibacillus donghaensis TaxID=414771 RepID=UPI00188446A1|nr:Ger(x)C family spore germination protein [Paenibacillus donghaensis]MBE9913940.1 Ger(x)C family spore germination protein [Paenibacillus donghaensis]
MRKMGQIGICLIVLLFIPGCWNSKDIQNLAYVTALGIDFEDGKYKSYVQILNFSNIAKNETSSLSKPIPIWLGTGEGRTLAESMMTLYSTSQLRVFWGHLKSVILSEKAMKHGMMEIYDMLNRYREVRYNILMYGTDRPIHEIMIQKSILNLSPLDTVMNTPFELYAERSFILPEYGFKIIAQINEPSGLAMIPCLTIDEDDWYEDKNKRPMFRINGAYFFQNKEFRGHLTEDELKGTRWVQRELVRSPINIPASGQPAATLVLEKPHLYIKPVLEKDKARFHLQVSVDAYIDELAKDIPHKKMEQMAGEVLKDEIRMSYNKGLQRKADVFMLDEKLYRKYPQKWHQLHRLKPFILDEDSLKSIKIRVSIESSGKYKERVK